MKHNWEYKRLGDICEILDSQRKPVTKNDRKSGPYPYYGASGIQDHVSDYIFDGDFLLVGEDGAKWGINEKTAFSISGKCWVNNHAHVLDFKNSSVSQKLVEYILCGLDLNKIIVGAVVPKLTKKNLISIPIPVPPLSVQEQIVGELDKINELIDDCRELLRILDALAQSLFYDTFGDYYNGNCIYFKPIKEVFETITDFVAAGSFASLRENVIYKDSPNFAQLVRTMDIKSNFTKGQFVYVDKHAFDFLWRVNLNSECIILPNIGVNCGEVYHLKPSYLRYKNNVLGPNAILIRSSCYNHIFLSFALKHDDFQKQLSKITSQVAQPKFNKTNLKELNILVPPLTLQEEFAERIEAIEAIKATTQQQLAALQTLLDSRMDYWFN